MDGRLKEGYECNLSGHRIHESQLKLKTSLGQHVHSVILCLSVNTIIRKDPEEIREIKMILGKI